MRASKLETSATGAGDPSPSCPGLQNQNIQFRFKVVFVFCICIWNTIKWYHVNQSPYNLIRLGPDTEKSGVSVEFRIKNTGINFDVGFSDNQNPGIDVGVEFRH